MINVAYCSDSEGYFGLEASLYSLLTHTKEINFYIFTMDYSREEYGELKEYHGLYPWQKNKLIKIVKYLDGKHSNITFIDKIIISMIITRQPIYITHSER